ncbi:MAG: PAS domain-containing sensor histidine kinase [Bacteroidales bacterium]
MSANFDLESFHARAQSIVENKSLISTNMYIEQLEDLINEIKPGNSPLHITPGTHELQGYLSKAKSRISSLFDKTPVGSCFLDANGKVVATNNAFCQILNLEQVACTGVDLRNFIDSESIELFNFQVQKIIASKSTLATNLKFIKGEKKVVVRFQTTYYNEGSEDFLQCIATDITDTKAIERELAASEAQFRNLLEASPTGILVLYKGRYIYSNQAAVDLFGYGKPDDLLEIPALETVVEGERAIMKARIERLANNVPNSPAEVTIICRNGHHKECESVSIPLVYANRLSALIMISDISKRKKDEKIIRESEKKYREMYQMLRLMCDNVPDMIWAKDLDNQYIFTNKAISEGLLNAVDTNEPIGKPYAFFAQREREKMTKNPDWHTFGELIQDYDLQVISNRQALKYDDVGNVKGEYLHLEVYKSPFFDSEGNIIGTVGSARNVTRKRWLERENDKMVNELTAQTARLNAVINVLPDLLFILNINGDFLDYFASNSNSLAFDPKRIKGLNLSSLFAPEEVERQIIIYKHCIETQSVQSFEYDLTADGETKCYEARVAPLNSTSVLAIVRDITEKKNSESQLKKYNAELIKAKDKAEESDRLKSAFLANMSHEIRTPMNSIMGFADLLNDPELDAEERLYYTGIILNRSEDLLQLINDILDISRIESGNATTSNSSCELNKLLDQLHLSFTNKLKLLPESHVQLVCEKDATTDKIVFEVDELKLKQIFINLLDNALKFTSSGSIHFGFKALANGIITLFVADTGIGIEPKYQEIIFERFRQAEIKNRNDYKGTGLGLSICKGNVELMGGKIWVESIPDKGSQFYFQLPFILQH